MKNTFVYACISALLLTACQPKATNEEHQASYPSAEEAETMVELTEEQAQAIGLEMGKIENKELTATLKANGHLTVPNNNKGSVTSLFEGVIKTLPVQIGEKVSKGQIIAAIENPEFIRLQEDFLSVKNELTLALEEKNRQEMLYQGNAGALKNLQNAQTRWKELEVKKAALGRQIQLMGFSPSSLTKEDLQATLLVRSPVSGVISELHAKIGSLVNTSAPIAEIIDNSSLHLDLHVYEKDLSHLEEGQLIHFTLTNNPVKEYDARIFSIGSAFESDSKTIPVHAEVMGRKTGLIDGMNVTAIVSLDKATTPAVPNDAVVESGGRFYIFIEKGSPDSAIFTFERTEVFKGVSEMGYTAITLFDPLPENTAIAIKGAYFIQAKLTNTGAHED